MRTKTPIHIKGFLSILFLISYIATIANTRSISTTINPTLTKEMILPIDGDILTIQIMDIAEPGDSGKFVFWDFNGLPIINGNTKMQVRIYKDSIIHLTKEDKRNVFTVNNDSILHLRNENRMTKTIDICQPLNIVFPLEYGKRYQKNFTRRTRYTMGMHLHEVGISETEVDGLGSLITPDGDTITNVLRLRNIDISKVYSVNNDTIMKPDSTNEFKATKIVETFRWFSDRCRYPIIEMTRERYITKSNNEESYYSMVYIPISEQQRIDQNKQRKIELKPSQKQEYQPNIERVNTSYNLSEKIQVSQLGNEKIILCANHGYNYNIEGVLTDAYGRIFKQIPRTPLNGNNGTITEISTKNLLPGEYVLKIVAGTETLTKKIVIR